MNRVTWNHAIVGTLFLVIGAGLVLLVALLFGTILPYADREAVILAQVFVTVGWGLGFILRGVYRTSFDTWINDLGPETLRKEILHMEQMYQKKFGGERK